MAMGSSSLIGPAERERLRTILERDLSGDVHLLLFVQPPSGLYVPGREEPQTGRQARQLMEELAGPLPEAAPGRLRPPQRAGPGPGARRRALPALLIRPWPEARQRAARRRGGGGREAAPGDPAGPVPPARVRFFGLPSGYEFATDPGGPRSTSPGGRPASRTRPGSAWPPSPARCTCRSSSPLPDRTVPRWPGWPTRWRWRARAGHGGRDRGQRVPHPERRLRRAGGAQDGGQRRRWSSWGRCRRRASCRRSGAPSPRTGRRRRARAARAPARPSTAGAPEREGGTTMT